ncbi:MAG: BrnT family toxin [Acidobacteriota bacterium]
MDYAYLLNEIHFEWDATKASENLKKHSISFESAGEIFFDPFLKVVNIEITDGEQRESVIGLTLDWKTLYVVYAAHEESIRLISARMATKTERLNYENQ